MLKYLSISYLKQTINCIFHFLISKYIFNWITFLFRMQDVIVLQSLHKFLHNLSFINGSIIIIHIITNETANIFAKVSRFLFCLYKMPQVIVIWEKTYGDFITFDHEAYFTLTISR